MAPRKQAPSPTYNKKTSNKNNCKSNTKSNFN